MKLYVPLILILPFLISSNLLGQEIVMVPSPTAQLGVMPANPSEGPGTTMTRMINRLGLGSDCGRCKELAMQMDLGGPAWVRQNRSYVIKSTISNASNLGHKMGPVRKMGVRYLVGRSVRLSSR